MNVIRFRAEIGSDGVIRPPAGMILPAGEVEVTVEPSPPKPPHSPMPQEHLIDRLARASAELGIDPAAFPEDLAENHDHYAHGAPRGVDRQQ